MYSIYKYLCMYMNIHVNILFGAHNFFGQILNHSTIQQPPIFHLGDMTFQVGQERRRVPLAMCFYFVFRFLVRVPWHFLG